MQKITFKGTILDFLSFLQAYFKRRQTPGLAAISPLFSVEEPKIEEISDNTRLAQFYIEPYMFASEKLEVIASLLPDEATLLTVTALKRPEMLESMYGQNRDKQIDFHQSQVKNLWESIVSELSAQGWLVETTNEEAEDYDLKNLRHILQTRLNLSDVRDLCFELEIDFENLGEPTLNGSIRELLIRMRQMSRVDDLIEACNTIRPDLEL